jgi:hypothetical protein
VHRLLALIVVVAAAVAATAVFAATPAADVDPSDFVRQIDNPWYPLRPGTTYVFRGVESGKPMRDVVAVTTRRKTILGVRCVVVRDTVYVDGRPTEATSDWFAQDRKGNVWYFGEATAELDHSGKVKSREGSWQAGVDGAKGGMFMPAHPQVGQEFRQEYYKGHAEDRFRVLSVSAPVRVPYTGSRRGLLTKEWTRLEPGVVGHKYYVHGVGLVEERSAGNGKEHTQLVTVRRG